MHWHVYRPCLMWGGLCLIKGLPPATHPLANYPTQVTSVDNWITILFHLRNSSKPFCPTADWVDQRVVISCRPLITAGPRPQHGQKCLCPFHKKSDVRSQNATLLYPVSRPKLTECSDCQILFWSMILTGPFTRCALAKTTKAMWSSCWHFLPVLVQVYNLLCLF